MRNSIRAMDNFKSIVLGVLLLICSPRAQADSSESAPSWLVTQPPSVTIKPQHKYHNTPFHVVLSSGRQARIWYSMTTADSMRLYENPVSLTSRGKYRFYYYAEDLFGNRSALDSAIFVFDDIMPAITLNPPPGRYRQRVSLQIKTSKPSRLFLTEEGKSKRPLEYNTVDITSRLKGVIEACDSAGNCASTSLIEYVIDSLVFSAQLSPPQGVYNRELSVSIGAPEGITIFYTFNPAAQQEWFTKYTDGVVVAHGVHDLRFFGEDLSGNRSVVKTARYIIDTIAPVIQIRLQEGSVHDTVTIVSSKDVAIYYTLDETIPSSDSPRYSSPLIIKREGRTILKAKAVDHAGNESPLQKRDYHYDTTPPQLEFSSAGGVFGSPQQLYITTDKPSVVYYTLDGTEPNMRSPIYRGEQGITISRHAKTILRCRAIDNAGNWSNVHSLEFVIDQTPPKVDTRIAESDAGEGFLVYLTVNKNATIYYEIEETGTEGPLRTIYRSPLLLRFGEQLRYMAVDSLGNRSSIRVLDELVRPVVTISPRGGLFNKDVSVTFETNVPGAIYYRVSPDTVFALFDQNITLRDEGVHIVHYYSESANGARSLTNHEQFVIDKTAPVVDVSVRKHGEDSLLILFSANENASIIYTLDGTDPQTSRTVSMAANRLNQSSDRVLTKRSDDMQLTFFSEDAAGNRSIVYSMDIGRPQVIPSVPFGAQLLYNRIVSVGLSSFDDATIYYRRVSEISQGDFTMYSDPITLMGSDTLMAYAIDALGFRGETDTFVYKIDLPPSAYFDVESTVVHEYEQVLFDASKSIDQETPSEKMIYKWDFHGNGTIDTLLHGVALVLFSYNKPGIYNPFLTVVDENDGVATYSLKIKVLKNCPEGMRAVLRSDGTSFCIDEYEWPNVRAKRPLANVSWTEAAVICLDAGKRLCTGDEWIAACRGSGDNRYPYGQQFQSESCPVGTRRVLKSGDFSDCQAGGVFDMTGNLWEWVDNREQRYPLMMGGGFKSGPEAHCEAASRANPATKADDVGFRCCK